MSCTCHPEGDKHSAGCPVDRFVDLDKCMELSGAAATAGEASVITAVAARVLALTSIDIATSLRILCGELETFNQRLFEIRESIDDNTKYVREIGDQLDAATALRSPRERPDYDSIARSHTD